jgi:FAD/FMN-containing dehydrogenase
MGYEVHEAMVQHNIALVAPSFGTVGTYGGYMAGGGHSSLGSLYGLASDQALSLSVVTAGGEFTTASPTVNSDLFYALRGGGGSKSSSPYLHH